MRVLRAMLLSSARIARTPAIALVTWLGVLALAALAVRNDLGDLIDSYGHMPFWEGPVMLDEAMHATGSGLGLGTALATLLAIALFSIACGAFALVGSGREKSSLAAIRWAGSRAHRLFAATLLGLAWLALASFVGRAIVVPAFAHFASRFGVSEWRCLLAAEVVGMLLLLPGVVAADLARARIMLTDARGYAAPFMGAVKSVLTGLSPWVAFLVALVLEALLQHLFAWRASRFFWAEVPIKLYLVLPALFVLVRVLVYATYVGGLASTVDAEEKA